SDSLRLCDGEARGVGEGGLGRLDISQRFPDDLLGYARAFAALSGDTGCFTNFPIAAAAFIDGFANLTVGDTLAKTDVHKNYPLSLFDVGDAKQNENDCQNSWLNGLSRAVGCLLLGTQDIVLASR